MLESFSEFSGRKKALKDKKKQLKKQMSDLGRDSLEIKKQEIQKKMNTYVNGASSF